MGVVHVCSDNNTVLTVAWVTVNALCLCVWTRNVWILVAVGRGLTVCALGEKVLQSSCLVLMLSNLPTDPYAWLYTLCVRVCVHAWLCMFTCVCFKPSRFWHRATCRRKWRSTSIQMCRVEFHNIMKTYGSVYSSSPSPTHPTHGMGLLCLRFMGPRS